MYSKYIHISSTPLAVLNFAFEFGRSMAHSRARRSIRLRIPWLDTNEIIADSEEEDFLIPPITIVAGPLNLLFVFK